MQHFVGPKVKNHIHEPRVSRFLAWRGFLACLAHSSIPTRDHERNKILLVVYLTTETRLSSTFLVSFTCLFWKVNLFYYISQLVRAVWSAVFCRARKKSLDFNQFPFPRALLTSENKHDLTNLFFSVRTVSYRSSFFPVDLWPACFALEPKRPV